MARSPGKPTPIRRPRTGATPAEERRPREVARGNGAVNARSRSATKPEVPKPPSTQRSATAKEAAVDSARARPKGRDAADAKRGRGRKARAKVGSQHADQSPLARSVDVHGDAHRSDRDADAALRMMELHWGDEPAERAGAEDIVTRWAKRGDTLLRHLAEHGAARHEYRADLKEGRFVWVDADDMVSAEAHARVLCCWSPTTSALVMGWADPLVRKTAVARLDGFPAERDAIEEEEAWRIAIEAAEAARAEFLYRVTTPDAWYFLALDQLRFDAARAPFRPSTPVGLVLRGLTETRRAVESRAEPAEVLRERLTGLGRALAQEAEYAYRGSDWVARLERTGRRLVSLADRLPRPSFKSVAAGRPADEWLGRDAVIELCEALALLEDEWALFASAG